MTSQLKHDPDTRLPHVDAIALADRVGVHEIFPVLDRERVELVLADLRELRIRHLRLELSFATFSTELGKSWYEWLLSRLAAEVSLLPCFVAVAADECASEAPEINGNALATLDPHGSAYDPHWYVRFVEHAVAALGQHFETLELASDPERFRSWTRALDTEWSVLAHKLGAAAESARRLGKRVVLGSAGPANALDVGWASLLRERDVMRSVDAVGLRADPEALHETWAGWPAAVHAVRDALVRAQSEAAIWITGASHSTLRHDERRQLDAFATALEAPVARMYWSGVRDTQLERRGRATSSQSGLTGEHGARKLLYKVWQSGGLEAVRESTFRRSRSHAPAGLRVSLITGGAGFIGVNLAHRLLSAGKSVLIVDNLSRPGVERNFHWLRKTHGGRVQFEIADVRDERAIRAAVARAREVFHFAAQTAVTTSLSAPMADFDVNVRGTLNVLEALRASEAPPPLLFTSTNKVYGGLSDVALAQGEHRYEPVDLEARSLGVSEQRPLDFHSPYGCSKGAADQYVIDYARSYGLSAVVFRMSCIYGPHQQGSEDQGWVAHFLLQALAARPVTIYGDGKQVRDILYVEDLIDAMLLAQRHMEAISGQAFNIGGGPDNTASLIEVLQKIGELHGGLDLDFARWRVGDQRYYVSNTHKFKQATGWAPRVGVQDGIEKLYRWLCAQQPLVARDQTQQVSA